MNRRAETADALWTGIDLESSIVYVVQEGEDGPYRVGWSGDKRRDGKAADVRAAFEVRLGTHLRVGNPRLLNLRKVLPGQGRKPDEQWHRLLEGRAPGTRMEGDWFDNTPEVREVLGL